MVYLNRYGYFEQVPFADSIPEFDVGFDHRRQLQPVELFKRPFSVELIGAGFDKLSNTRYFALRFPRMLKIYKDRSFKDTISFEELQEIAKQYSEVPEDSKKEETRWLEKLGIPDYLVGKSRPYSPSYYWTKVPWVDSQIAQQQEKAITSTRKQIIASEAFPQDDSAIKQSRQG
jgi:DNA ligase 4